MNSFKKSLATLAGRLALAAALAALLPLSGLGQEDVKNPLKRDARRSFYLTKTTHTGAQALAACAEGYHMASLWEILDPSNLRYDTALGFTQADSGSGPPIDRLGAFGWIRTGFLAGSGTVPGSANCRAYTMADDGLTGTLAFLTDNWDTTFVTVIDPWGAFTRDCASAERVWCVQD